MGNNQSNPQEYTPEQYKQFLDYQEQQRRAAVFQTNTPLHMNQQSVASQQSYSNPITNEKGKHQNNVNYVNTPNYTQVNNNQLTNNRPNNNNGNYNEINNNVNVAYNNQQIRRTQIKPELNNLDKKLIPDLQQKKYMPSVENHFQDAYQQRMIDNLSIGSKNMVSGATYTGTTNIYGGQNSNQPNNLGQFNDNTVNLFQPDITNMGSNLYKNYDVSNKNSHKEALFIKNEKAREIDFIRMQEKRIEEEQRRFKEEQTKRRSQFSEELSEVENLKYDPAQILGLDKNIKHDINDIKKAYRNLALRYHPDKGGSEEIFKILTKAYIILTKKNEKDSYSEKSFFDLKSQMQNNTSETIVKDDEEFDVQHFNSIFNKNRLEDLEVDNGYGDWMKNETKEVTKSGKIFNQKFNLDIFNKVFDELKTDDESTNKVTEQITVYKEPEILPIGAGLQYSDVDYNKVGDYSREFNVNDNTKGLFFTDYKKAHTNTTLINPNAVNKREQYKDVEELTLVREKQSFTMTDDDRQHFEIKKRLDEEKENQRLLRLKERDDALANHSSKVNKLLLGKDVSVPTRQLSYNN
jgi:curved DNA-binding protein CbpA